MKPTPIIAVMIVLIFCSWSMAQEAPFRKVAKPSDGAIADPEPATKNMSAVRQTAQAFTDAFNRHDAKAVAALWTKDGEYIDETGRRFAGREAIEQEYARFFAAEPRSRISIVIDGLRPDGDAAAVEQGRAMVELGPARPGSFSQYVAKHAKVDGKWLMASVRDLPRAPSSADALTDLEWLVGKWTAEEQGGKMEATCRWVVDKKYLERSYTVTRGGKTIASGVQMIGWNPQVEQIQSWTFTSDGGHAVGLWSLRKGGWAIESRGTLADGTLTNSVNLLTRIDDRAFSWQSVERSVGDTSMPDTEEVLLQRVADAKK